jgi:hypothetical protein
MRRIFRLRVLLVIMLAAAVAAAVATALTQKQRLQSMSPDERREFLGAKLAGRMTDEQIDQIAAQISEKLDRTSAPNEDHDPSDSDELGEADTTS